MWCTCQNIEHVPDLKLVHVKFIQKFHCITDEETHENELFSDYDCGVDRPELLHDSTEKFKLRVHSEKQKTNSRFISHQIPQHGHSSSSTVTPVKRKGKEIVHSISLSKMIRLGKVIRPAVAPVELFEFDVEKMEWSDIVHAVQFNVEKEPFGQGGI